MLQEAPRVPGPGDLVVVRGDRWRVDRVVSFDDCTRLDLAGIGSGNGARRRSLLVPFDRPEAFRPRSSPRLVSRAGWMRALRLLLSAQSHAGGLRAPATATLDLLPHQLEPALAIVRGLATRVLLADEVGLGKTIQAGLVAAELALRGRGDRVLVLTPAGLRDQWARELTHRFAIDAAVVDLPALARRVAAMPRGVNPWSAPGTTIVSLDFAKRTEVLGPLAAHAWDLLIVDEAHGAATAPERLGAVRRLAAGARVVLLLTATPHAGDDRAFAALCAIGRLPGEGPIAVFRRTRADVGLPGRRRTHRLDVRPTAAEAVMHEKLDRYIRVVWHEASRRRDRAARLVMTVLWKRALSSASSLQASLERRIALLSDGGGEPWQNRLPLCDSPEDDDPLDDLDASLALGVPGLADPRRERDWLQDLRAAARAAAAAESKIARLLRLLSRLREPAIVYTEYRDTLLRLEAVLAPHVRVETIHGGIDADQRRDACRRFTTGEVGVLLATDAAAEGLNLHARCRLVVNLELPWNPMRLEQRAGRVDRLGQRRTPHVVQLIARGSAEARLAARHAQKIRRASMALDAAADGAASADDEAVADGLLRAKDPPTPSRPSGHAAIEGRHAARLDLRYEALSERERLLPIRELGQRTLGPSGTANDSSTAPALLDAQLSKLLAGRPFLGRVRRSRSPALPAGVLFVCLLRFLGDDGRLYEQRLLPVHFSTEPRPGRWLPRRLRRWCRRDGATAVTCAAASALEAARAREIDLVRDLTAAHTLARNRDASIAASRRPRTRITQPGLFDRRELRRAATVVVQSDALLPLATSVCCEAFVALVLHVSS